MAIILNRDALAHAEKLISAGEVEKVDSNWAAEKPTQDELVKFINTHSMAEYGLWFLGKNNQYPENAKEHYVYPHGDLKEVQRCALVDSMKETEKNGLKEIAHAAKRLLDMIDKKK